MGQPNFWDNQEKAQGTIGQLKPLNGLLQPFEALQVSTGALQALAELTEEDATLEVCPVVFTEILSSIIPETPV